MVKSGFNKNVLKLFTGASLSTLISFAVLPMLTRLYSTEDFGNFQLLVSTITLFTVIGSLKYEMTIVIPKSEEESNKLIILSLLVLIMTTLLFSILFFLFGQYILSLLNAKQLEPYILIICIGIFFGGLIHIMQSILVKNKSFGDFSKNYIVQSSVSQGASISLGLLSPSFLGLFISHISGLIVGSFLIMKKNKLLFKKNSLTEYKSLLHKYKKFPLINTPMVFLNTLSLQLPIFMLAKYFSPEIVGVYMLAHRIANKPINLIGNSISQVYYKEASDSIHESKSALLDVYKSTIKKLVLIGISFVIGIILLVSPLISLVFGSEWGLAGYYIKIIMFWIFFQFINSPVSKTLSIIDKQELGFILIFISIIIRFLAMYFINDTPDQMLWALSISAGLFYFIFNVFIYLSIRRL